MRFLFTRRWVLFALTVAALAWLATQLGQWQFGRLDERRELNTLVAKNLDLPPVPVADVLSIGKDPAKGDEWRKVVVHGTWDDENTIVLKYQTRDGGPGVDVVTPLVTCAQVETGGNGDPDDDTCATNGPAVLVDRGWMKTDNSGGERPKLPAATAGQVTVVGWVRRNATGGSTEVNDLATRAVSSKAASAVLNQQKTGYELYGGWLDLHTETPEAEGSLAAVELPDDTSEGPHFFYGLQWWFFAALAIFGFGYLAYDERRQARSQARSEGAQHAPVDREHDSGHER
ncbi:cytochrome oxidase assembly protein ShyY1 [Marmoricola sp. OAE513]|uniref:SURF1 family protein n=1 Tax=Marmoricola sp. OAE513 TaxID=2817894 RepID=UPI001AEB5169